MERYTRCGRVVRLSLPSDGSIITADPPSVRRGRPTPNGRFIVLITGGCYCGDVRYKFEGEVQASLQCHCRECQYITGGNPNVIMVLPLEGFGFEKGEPATFKRTDIDNAVTRLFCPRCGTAIGTRTPTRPTSMVIKVGTLDDPSIFKAKVAIFTIDKQAFHHIPQGVPAFERRPT